VDSNPTTYVAAERGNERVKAIRAVFLAYPPNLDPKRTFFIDETGSTTAMARDHARSPRGERVHDEVPQNYGDVITIDGALTADGLTARFTYRSGTTKAAFVTCVCEILSPELEPGDAVVLDNLVAHKDPRVREWVEGAGAKLYFLPPYIPDSNPIELAWSWVKCWLKTARARTEQAVDLSLRMAMDMVDAAMASRWNRHFGCEIQAE
jgi:transposase